jgi:hypothetical protein
LKGGSNAAASSLEELGRVAEPIAPQLMELSGQQAVRSILISMGKMPTERYFGEKQRAEGVLQNGRRMEWKYPSPDIGENKRRPKEAESGD